VDLHSTIPWKIAHQHALAPLVAEESPP
jgi:hypothetical protein